MFQYTDTDGETYPAKLYRDNVDQWISADPFSTNRAAAAMSYNEEYSTYFIWGPCTGSVTVLVPDCTPQGGQITHQVTLIDDPPCQLGTTKPHEGLSQSPMCVSILCITNPTWVKLPI